MNAGERTIDKVLTEQICYEIPPYQRPYSWETENVQQMLEDIWEAYQANDPEYFIGSVITIEQERVVVGPREGAPCRRPEEGICRAVRRTTPQARPRSFPGP